jgi:hypothetical protein
MTGALIAPVLRPFGGDQLITALNALHPEAGTPGRRNRSADASARGPAGHRFPVTRDGEAVCV